MAEQQEFALHRVVNAGGPRLVHHRGGHRLLEKGETFVGEFDAPTIEVMNRPGRMLHVTVANKDDEKAFAARNVQTGKSAPLVPASPDGSSDQFDAMSDEELRAHIEAASGKAPHPSAKRETMLRRARGGVEE